jgi:hypothetical protein
VIRGLREPVRLTSPEAQRILDLADIWAVRSRSEVTLVSANDHIHSPRSAHYAGLAVDLHASNPDGLARALKDAGYRVLWKVPGHYTHIHVEVAPQAPTHTKVQLADAAVLSSTGSVQRSSPTPTAFALLSSRASVASP